MRRATCPLQTVQKSAIDSETVMHVPLLITLKCLLLMFLQEVFALNLDEKFISNNDCSTVPHLKEPLLKISLWSDQACVVSDPLGNRRVLLSSE